MQNIAANDAIEQPIGKLAMTSRNVTVLLALTVACLTPPASRAAVVFYTTQSSFSAASMTSLAVSFEGFTPADQPIFSPFTLGGVTFTPITSTPNQANLLVRTRDGGQGIFAVPPSSNVLTSRGNENFALSFSTATTAVAFDTYTNISAPPIVTVLDTSNSLLATYMLTQAPGSLGFLGIVSDANIGRVVWLATDGQMQDTAIDNVRVGTRTTVPEPASLVMMGTNILTLGGLAVVRRRRDRDGRSPAAPGQAMA